MAWYPDLGNMLNQDIFDALATFITQAQQRAEQIADEFAMPLFCLKAVHLADATISMKELGTRMGYDPSYVTMIANTLEERGLAKREPNAADRRAKHLVLTADGLEMKGRLEQAMLGQAPWSRLEPTEQRSLLALVRKMSALDRTTRPPTRGERAARDQIGAAWRPADTGAAPAVGDRSADGCLLLQAGHSRAPGADEPPVADHGTDPAAAVSRRGRARAAASLEIRQAARRILTRHGHDAVTLRAIAREAGMTAPALYRYYGSREDLISHLTADIFLEVTDDIRAATNRARDARHGDATAKLTVARQEFRRWSLSHRAEFRLLFAAPLPRPGQHDLAAQCEQKFAWAFLELFLQRWPDHPASAHPEPANAQARQPLGYLSSWLQADLPPSVLIAFVRCWIQLHAQVALEVSGYPGIASLSESGTMHTGTAWMAPGPARW